MVRCEWRVLRTEERMVRKASERWLEMSREEAINQIFYREQHRE